MESPRVMAKTLKKSCETSAKVTPKCRGSCSIQKLLLSVTIKMFQIPPPLLMPLPLIIRHHISSFIERYQTGFTLRVFFLLSLNLSRWMEVCLVEELPPTTELEEGLRNGVYLAKLAKFFAPKMVSEKKIYDVEQTRYKVTEI